MIFFLPLLYFCFANGLLVYISKKTFGKCIPITLMINAFTYFFSQVIFHTFKIGFLINLLFAFFFVGIVIINIIRKKDIKILRENFFSKGFYIFIVIYICIYIFDFNRTLTVWDEFSHWGLMVKEMHRLDQFYSSSFSSLMVHKDYPPMLSLFELFYTNLSGTYQEANLIKALHLFGCSLFISAIYEKDFSFHKGKVVLKSILMLGCIFLTFLLFDQHGIIHTLYIDYTVAILTAYLLFIIVFEKNPLSTFHLIRLSLGCSFLLLTKQVAISFYVMILFMFVIDFILKKPEKKLKISRKDRVVQLSKIIVLLVMIPLFIWKGWNFYIEKLNITEQFKTSDIKITKLYGILSLKEGEKWQQDAAKNYIKAISTRGMMTTKISLSYPQCMILILILIYGMGSLYKKYIHKKQTFSMIVTLLVGSLGYAILMLLLYMFNFGPDEGPKLASFNRYMPTYILIGMSLIIMIFTYIDSMEDKINISLKRFILLFCLLFLIQNPKLLNKCIPKIMKSKETDYYNHAQIINNKTKSNSKIFIIAQDSEGEYQFYTKYYMDGSRTTNLKYFNFPLVGINNYQEYFFQNIQSYMLEFDYLYLAKIDDTFIQNYSFLFPEGDIHMKELYRIKKHQGKVQLQLIE